MLLVSVLIWILINVSAVNSSLDYLPAPKLMSSAQGRIRITRVIKKIHCKQIIVI